MAHSRAVSATSAPVDRRRADPPDAATTSPMRNSRVVAIAARGRHRLHARLQLAEVEGLHQVVVRAGLQPLDPVGDLVARGQHDHRAPVAAARIARSTVKPAAIRQAEVEQHQRMIAGPQRGIGLGAAGAMVHGMARRASGAPAPRAPAPRRPRPAGSALATLAAASSPEAAHAPGSGYILLISINVSLPSGFSAGRRSPAVSQHPSGTVPPDPAGPFRSPRSSAAMPIPVTKVFLPRPRHGRLHAAAAGARRLRLHRHGFPTGSLGCHRSAT